MKIQVGRIALANTRITALASLNLAARLILAVSKNLTRIQATLPASEVAQIEKVVKRNLRKSFFQDYSWTSIKAVATHISEYLHPRILSINEISSSCVVVDTKISVQSEGGFMFVMTKGTYGWGNRPNPFTLILVLGALFLLLPLVTPLLVFPKQIRAIIKRRKVKASREAVPSIVVFLFNAPVLQKRVAH